MCGVVFIVFSWRESYVFRRSVAIAVGLAGVFLARSVAPTCAVDQRPEQLPPSARESILPGTTAGDVTPYPAEPTTKPITSLTTDVRPPAGQLPDDVAARRFDATATPVAEQGPRFSETVYFWQASNLAHRPLRFEQAYVERYGYNYGLLQPIVSGVEFAGDLAVSPVRCLAVPSWTCIYTLGPARPGTYGTNCPRKW